MEARRKVGKYGQEAKYKTLDSVLGIRDVERTGDFASEEDLSDATDAYMLAVIEANKQGKPAPDIVEWLAQREAVEADFRIKDVIGAEDDGRDDW
jgi:hypothetical protein